MLGMDGQCGGSGHDVLDKKEQKGYGWACGGDGVPQK